MRRSLSPVAWCALELLADLAQDDDEVVAASVRSLASELGVAKNTAHRALAALTRAGLVAAVQDRDATGRFSAGRYRLHLNHPIPITTPHPTRTSSTSTSHNSQHTPTQLSLLNPS